MFGMILMMMAFLYSAFFSIKWLWLFPIALVISFVEEQFLREEEKKNKKRD